MRFANKHGFRELNNFPGCNQLVVSNHAFIYPEFRGKGLGDKEHKKQLKRAKKLGYNYIVCTVCAGNKAQIKILEKNNWNLLDSFFNTETGRDISLYGRSL